MESFLDSKLWEYVGQCRDWTISKGLGDLKKSDTDLNAALCFIRLIFSNLLAIFFVIFMGVSFCSVAVLVSGWCSKM